MKLLVYYDNLISSLYTPVDKKEVTDDALSVSVCLLT
jgi:hypothetical protein